MMSYVVPMSSCVSTMITYVILRTFLSDSDEFLRDAYEFLRDSYDAIGDAYDFIRDAYDLVHMIA